MAARKWNVWSIDRENLRGLVVNEGTEKQATADAEHRNAVALRLKTTGVAFVALPHGRQPSESDLPPLEPVPAAPEARDEHSPTKDEPEPRCRYTRIYWGRLRTSDDPADADLYLESPNGTTLVCFSPGDMPALRAAVIPQDPDLAGLKDEASRLIADFFDDAEPDMAAWRERNARLAQRTHARGYSLGVQDVEHVRAGLTEAERMTDWLQGFYDSGAAENEKDADALRRVLGLLQQRLDEQKEAGRAS